MLPIFEKATAPRASKWRALLNNLAQVLSQTDRAAEAEPLMRRVIVLFEKNFEFNHPSVAIALNNLARLLENTGRPAEAEPLARRHLHIFKSSKTGPVTVTLTGGIGYRELRRPAPAPRPRSAVRAAAHQRSAPRR